MSKERELLEHALNFLIPTSWDNEDARVINILIKNIEELLAQPDQSNEPVVNSLAAELLHNKAWYQNGYGDAKQELKRKPLSDGELPTNNPKINTDGERLAFHAGIRWAEKAHGIGVDK